MDLQKLKENKWIISIIILALIIRIIFAFQTPVRIWDETVYSNLGHDLSKNPFDYSLKNALWSDVISSSKGEYSWPNIGFRAPLLPYTLSIFYFLNLESLIIFLMPLIGTLSVYLIYLLGKEVSNKKTGIYSALFLAIIPLHSIWSGMVLTNVYAIFFILLTLLSFHKGYLENNKKHKVLFGAFFALAILARYTVLWIAPIFPLYFLIREKSFKFLKDKYIWYSVLLFTLILFPLLVYSQLTYENPFGAFIHGNIASNYWISGGTQGAFFYFKYWLEMFSTIGIIFIFALLSNLKERFKEKNLLIFWIFFFSFLIFSLFTAHKEKRFLMPLVIPICIISANYLQKLKINYKKIFLFLVILITLFSLTYQGYNLFNNYYSSSNYCFKESLNYLEEQDRDFKIINDESAPIYYYLHKQTSFLSSKDVKELRESSKEKETYLLYTDLNMPLYIKENKEAFTNWNKEFKIVFECKKDWAISKVYIVN